MTGAGWVFMLASLAFVCGLAGWCYYRLARLREEPPGGNGSRDAETR